MSKNTYAKGQKDGAKHKYNPPHQRVGEAFIGLLFDRSKKDIQDIRDYHAGRKNAKKQR